MNLTTRLAALAGALLVLVGAGSCNKARGGSQGGRYSDSELRSIKGVQVSTSGYETTFKIPWMYTHQADRDILFKRLTQSYVEAVGDLRDEFLKKKATTKGFEKAALVAQYNDQIRAVVDKFAVDASQDAKHKRDASATAESQPPEIYMDISKQNLAQTYLLPQAISIFAAGNFSTPSAFRKPLERVTAGVVNQITVNVAFVYVAQMFVVVTVDNHSKREKLGPDGTPVRSIQFDATLMLMPSAGPGHEAVKSSLALAEGGGANAAWGIAKAGAQTFGKACKSVGRLLPMQFGLGLVWGPLDTPHDLLGYSGASFDFDGSPGGRTEGLFARLVALGKFGKAPLFFTFLGADCAPGGGTSAAMAITLTTFMDPVTLTHWISGGADPEKIKNAAAVSQLRKEAKEGSSMPAGSSVEFSL